MIRLASEELACRPGTSLCPDCPMTSVDALAHMIPPQANVCAFRSLAVRARAPLPSRWFREYGLGIVRRGIVLRQRLDSHGHAIAVDAVGPGGLVSLSMAVGGGEDSSVGGYAVNDVILCACPTEPMQGLMATHPQTPRDVVRLQAQALDRMERLVDARGRMTVVERVAATLLALVDSLSPFRRTEVILVGSSTDRPRGPRFGASRDRVPGATRARASRPHRSGRRWYPYRRSPAPRSRSDREPRRGRLTKIKPTNRQLPQTDRVESRIDSTPSACRFYRKIHGV